MINRFIAFIPVFVAIVTATVPGCSRSASQAVEDNPAATTTDGGKASGASSAGPPALVGVEIIRQDRVTPKFRAVGNVRPVQTSIVASGSDGIVEEFPIEVGAYVAGGDTPTVLSRLKMASANAELAEQQAVLKERQAELDEIQVPRSEDIDEARARQQSAEVAYATAKRRLAEMTALGERGAANPTEVKDAQDNLDAAEQNRLAAAAVLTRISTPRRETVRQAEARVEAQQKHVEFLESELEKRTTKAPFDGFVVEEHTNIGHWLSKGAPVVTLADLKSVEVEVQVDQQYIDQIHPASQVALKIQGTGSSREWTGEVTAVVSRSNWEEGSRSFPVIIRVQNEGFYDKDSVPLMPPTPALREGMMAEAEFSGDEVDAILVPKDSVVRTSRGNFIYIINPSTEGTPLSVRQVEVTLGIGSGTWIQVTGENLETGMQVVTEGAERLRAYQPVVIVKGGESDAAGQAPVTSP